MAAPQFAFPSQTLRSLILACTVAWMAGPHIVAQSAPPTITRQMFTPETDISLGISGQLTPTRTSLQYAESLSGPTVSQTTQGTSPSAGVLGVIHQAIYSWLGYNINLGYSRFPERYSRGEASRPTSPTEYPPSSFSQGSIRTNMYELTMAYSIQGPRTERWSTSAQVGAGGLFFLPIHNPSPFAVQCRPAMVFGTGFTYMLSSHLSLRAEYRGLFYKNPTFHNSNTSVPISDFFVVTNEPTVSVVYIFGHKSKR